MQIQLWEGTVLRAAKAVLQGTPHYSGNVEIGGGEELWRTLWLNELLQTIRSESRQRDAEHTELRGVLELEKVASCGRPTLGSFHGFKYENGACPIVLILL